MELIGRSVVIRDTMEADIGLFAEWERLPEVKEFFSIADGQTLEEAEAVYRRDLADAGRRQYTVLLRADMRPIGRVVLADVIEGWKAEIFRIYIGDLSERGRGRGRETMELLLKLMFEDWRMERVYLDHYLGNPAAELYLSLGFVHEGVLRKNCRKNGKLYDVRLMSQLREEYFAHRDGALT